MFTLIPESKCPSCKYNCVYRSDLHGSYHCKACKYSWVSVEPGLLTRAFDAWLHDQPSVSAEHQRVPKALILTGRTGAYRSCEHAPWTWSDKVRMVKIMRALTGQTLGDCLMDLTAWANGQDKPLRIEVKTQVDEWTRQDLSHCTNTQYHWEY